MPGFSFSLDTSGFERNAKAYLERLETTLKAEIPLIAAEMVEDILTRTPSEDTEYSLIMGSSVPRSGDTSGDTDARTRFIRSPGMWLRDLVKMPGVNLINPGALTIELGHLPTLQLRSQFSWRNYSARVGSMEEPSGYGVFEWFEYGGTHTVTPRHEAISPEARGTYYLRPSESIKVPSMTKTYPRFAMYSAAHISKFAEAVQSRVSLVPFH